MMLRLQYLIHRLPSSTLDQEQELREMVEMILFHLPKSHAIHL